MRQALEILEKIPKLPQRQDAVLDQLMDLWHVANKLGMYDAADFISRSVLEKVRN